MTRHPFDPVAFVLGAVTLAAGITVLAGRSLLDDADVLMPAGLLGLGAALLVRVAAGRGRTERLPTGVPARDAPASAPLPRDAVVDGDGDDDGPDDLG
ncbi:MAG TPA: hypothetical protein VFZ79_19735 [Acidimicrobiales bacterium]